MSTPKSPASRVDRIKKASWWPPLAYYGGLVRASPRLLSKAASDVERLVSVILLVAAVVGLTITLTGREYQAAGLIIAAVVVLGFLRLNYQEVAKRDGEIAKLRRDVIGYQRETMFDPFYRGLVNELVDETALGSMYEYRQIERQLDDPAASAAGLTAEFDQADSRVARHLALIDEAEVTVLRAPLDSALIHGDWRERLRTVIAVRKTRLESIHIRQKGRLDREIEERKKAKAAGP